MMTLLTAMMAAALAVPAAPTPLLDGRCSDEEWSGATLLYDERGYSARVIRDSRYVYLCLTSPAGELGMVDLFAFTPLRNPVTLHASAKLGQWPATEVPPRGFKWWNNVGWTSQENALLTMKDGQPSFHPLPQREFQLSIRHFGPGPWRVMVQPVVSPDAAAINLPASAKVADPSTWIELTID